MGQGATLRVTHPPDLISHFGFSGTVRTSLGNFGHITYGTTMLAPLVHPDHNQNGCEPFLTFFEERCFVLVDAGDCPITTKVRHIENAGGQLAVIADAFFEDVEDVWMEDVDGSGFSLAIPGMMISKADGNTFKEALAEGKRIMLSANLEISHTMANSVELTLWYGSVLDIPEKLIEELYDY